MESADKAAHEATEALVAASASASTSASTNNKGEVNEPDGLRGDAKALWREVRDKVETRVRMVCLSDIDAATSSTTGLTGSDTGLNGFSMALHEEYGVALDSLAPGHGTGHDTGSLGEGTRSLSLTVAAALARQPDVTAAVIVWAGSYEPAIPPLVVGEGEGEGSAEVVADTPTSTGRVAIDPAGRLYAVDGGVELPNLYGIGLGFDEAEGGGGGEGECGDGRANAVSSYTQQASAKILAGVLGTDAAYGPGMTSWEDRCAAMAEAQAVLSAGSDDAGGAAAAQAQVRRQYSGSDEENDGDDEGRTGWGRPEAPNSPGSGRRTPRARTQSPAGGGADALFTRQVRRLCYNPPEQRPRSKARRADTDRRRVTPRRSQVRKGSSDCPHNTWVSLVLKGVALK